MYFRPVVYLQQTGEVMIKQQLLCALHCLCLQAGGCMRKSRLLRSSNCVAISSAGQSAAARLSHRHTAVELHVLPRVVIVAVPVAVQLHCCTAAAIQQYMH